MYKRDTPHAILHVDGDAFFASCEVAKNPVLRGKPVVVGGMRGIAVALTYEAKARGVVRGMPVFQIKKLCPEAVILPGDYDLYETFAHRMYAIVRRHALLVEEYSVDECFADISGDPEVVARNVQHDLLAELGVSFSVGVAATKVLAKVASKFKKPKGLVCIPRGLESAYLAAVPVGKVWGIGASTAQRLYRMGITTALDFARLPEWRVTEEFAKPHRTIWHELNGESLYPVHGARTGMQKSIAATRTFRPSTSTKALVYAHLVKNIEEACRRARAHGLVAKHAYFFLKSHEFQYKRCEVELVRPTNVPTGVVAAILSLFEREFNPKILYRATGVTLSNLSIAEIQGALFGDKEASAQDAVFSVADLITGRFGKRALFLAPALPVRTTTQFERHFALPFLGDVV